LYVIHCPGAAAWADGWPVPGEKDPVAGDDADGRTGPPAVAEHAASSTATLSQQAAAATARSARA
jgi:hypothetical protein